MLENSINHAHHVAIELLRFIRQPLAVAHAKHLHSLMVFEIREQLRSDEEVLPAVWLASDIDKGIVNCTLILRIHTLSRLVRKAQTYEGGSDLVDFIYQRKRSSSKLRQAHEVHDGREGSFLHQR